MKLLAFSVLASCVLGHNWLETPQSYNANMATTAKPCPEQTVGYQGLEVEPETKIPLVWTDNHAGTFWAKVVPAAQKNDLEALAKTPNASGYVEWAARTRQGNVTMPDAPGSYTVQWGWSGYRNCFDVKIASSAPPVPSPGADCEQQTEQGRLDTCWMRHGPNSMCNAQKKCQCKPSFSMDENEVCFNLEAPDTAVPDCASFCQDAIDECTGASKIYDSVNQCLAICANWPIGGPGPQDKLMKKNTLSCRFFHLHIEGATMQHCPHASKEAVGKCDQGAVAPGASFTIKGTKALNAARVKILLELQQTGGTVESVLESDVAHHYVVVMKFNDATAQSEFTQTKGDAILTTLKKNAQISDFEIHSDKKEAREGASTTKAKQTSGDVEASGAIGWVAPSALAVAFSNLFV